MYSALCWFEEERRTHNPSVGGSSPSCPTLLKDELEINLLLGREIRIKSQDPKPDTFL